MSYVIALFGIMMSGVLATVITHYLTTTKEQVFFFRKKAEELYLVFDAFDNLQGGYFLAEYPLVKGAISLDQFNDMIIERGTVDADAGRDLAMLIDIYFPDVQPAFSTYLEKRDALNRILSDHKKAYITGQIGTEFFKPFHEAMLEWNPIDNEVKAAVIAAARRFASPDPLQPWRPVRTR